MAKIQRKPYVLTPEDFFNRDERKLIMKTCREFAELDLLKGRQTWPVRFMLVDLALYSGLRVAEIAALKIEDLHLTGNDPFLIVRNGKRGKKRTVYFDKQLAKHLNQFIDYKAKSLKQSIELNAPLFSGREDKHSPPITLMKSFKKAVITAGIRKELSIHSARHTYATFLLHDTGNLRYVQQQLGHSNISMTSIYASILPEENGTLANKIQRDE
ncbi:MAG: site-specific integrase [Bacteroidales bacterium]|nr:site-specific integrase [Bacteroidales bacterium]